MTQLPIQRILGRVVGQLARWYRRWGIRRTDVRAESVLRAARATIDRSRFCVVVTGTGDQPAARVLQPRRPDGNLVIHLGISPTSRKADDIRRTGRATLVYTDYRRGAGVTVYAAADLLADPTTCREQFLPTWRSFWPTGPDDRAFVVVRCVPRAIEVWDGSRGITPPPFGLAGARIELLDGGWNLVVRPADGTTSSSSHDEVGQPATCP
jgi:general stress protein 26